MIYKWFLSTLFFCLLTTGAWAEVKLFISNSFEPYPPEASQSLIERLHQEDPEKNILIYVHGRGRDVRDEWESLEELEREYGVRVLMFDWPSWTSLLSRPVKNAENSSVELFKVFNAIKEFKERKPEKSFSLLCHSMGNVVFSHFMKQYYISGYLSQNNKPLFENYIANAPDVAMRGHSEWLKKIDFAKRRYILMNNRDIVLLLSYLLDIKERNPYYYKLGLGFQNLPLSDRKKISMMDPDSTYIDFSYSLKNQHRYFQEEKEAIIDVLKPLVNGFTFYPKLIRGKVKFKNNINFVYDDKDDK